MRFALFKEVPKRQRRKKRKLNDGGAVRKGGDHEGSDDDSDGSGNDMPAPVERMSVPPAHIRPLPGSEPAQDPIWGDESQDVQMDVTQPPAVAGPTNDGRIRPERFVIFFLLMHLINIFVLIGSNNSDLAWQIFSQRDCRMMSRYSSQSSSNLSMRVWGQMRFMGRQRQRKHVRRCRIKRS